MRCDLGQAGSLGWCCLHDAVPSCCESCMSHSTTVMDLNGSELCDHYFVQVVHYLSGAVLFAEIKEVHHGFPASWSLRC